MTTPAEVKQQIAETLASKRHHRESRAAYAQAEKNGELYQILANALEEHAAPDVVWALGIAVEDYAHGCAAQGAPEPLLLQLAEQIQRAHNVDALRRAELGECTVTLRACRLAVVAGGWLNAGAARELARNLAGIHADDLDHASIVASVERRRAHFGLTCPAESVSLLATALLAVPA